MADRLIEHLEKKSKEHSALEMLLNQWGFDKNLIPKALQNIGSLFPHYSRHDESHSKQILINIERILGSNIQLLTATDTWLILEAAYWHDIGMIVPQSDRETAFESVEFKEFLEEIANSTHHELSEFAKSLRQKEAIRHFNSSESPLDYAYKLNELMAEWFRRKHPSRANAIVQSPWTTIGISSPRTELIPSRLFRTLGHICEMHGAPFEKIMGLGGLPFREGGLAQEDCHPRFVACLLRMGDLLDLDNHRFCPVMQRIAGEGRSCISKAHEDKHASIRHFRLDRERIEITAECETIDGYLEAFKWFNWLKKEMQDQMSNWQDIVPNRDLGLLPTLGEVKLNLHGELQILNEGQRPQFSIDQEKAITLIQGSNLYATDFACIRELLQNAVDSTAICTWIKESRKSNKETWESPNSAKSILEKYPIEVDLIETPNHLDSIKSRWTIIIKDHGTGISREDLSFMAKIGASQKNTTRQDHIQKMPEWLKPSGAFGIGLQSAFLICENIKITTKSIFTNETLEIILHSPTGPNEGLIQIREIKDDPTKDHGATVEITVDRNNSIAASHINESTLTGKLLSNYDPLLSEELPIGGTRLADQIYDFSKLSQIPIKAKIKDKNGKLLNIVHNPANDKKKAKLKFIKIGDQELEISYDIINSDHFGGTIDSYYRGQQFESRRIFFPHFSITINLLSGKAGTWLNASRDKIAAHSIEALKKLILDALKKEITSDLEKKLIPPEKLPLLSLAVEGTIYRGSHDWSDLAQKLENMWLRLPLNEKHKTIGDLLESKNAVITVDNNEAHLDSCCDAVIPDIYDHSVLYLILREWQKKQNNSVKVLSYHDIESSKIYTYEDNTLDNILEGHYFYKLCSPKEELYSANALLAEIRTQLAMSPTNLRIAIPASTKDWPALQIKGLPKGKARTLFPRAHKQEHIIVLPFLFSETYDDQKTFIAHATENCLFQIAKAITPFLVHANTPESEIISSYKDLIKEIDNSVSGATEGGVWTAARTESEI